MRDIALLATFIVFLPFALTKPWIGVILWVWLSVMNPHRLTYGFAYDMSFAAITAGVTLLGFLITKDRRHLPMTPPVVALMLFTIWMCIASLFPYHPDSGYSMWSRVMKIMLMTFVALALVNEKKHILWMVWTIVLSLGFYGVKGGAFTALHGGNFLVWGPQGSFIEGNNELALALIIVIPLMRFVQLNLTNKWHRRGMALAMLLCALAAMGSHSRGAFVAIAAMGTFLWWKSRNKVGMGIVLAIVGIGVIAFMPDEWMQRMNTIQSYSEDSSAQGRINAWYMAFNLATDRIFGGGYDIYDLDVFARYAPNPLDVHAAHSIYFQVLGEHGFIGLILFVAIGASTWLAASSAKRIARKMPDIGWIVPLMDMCKVSMVGYAVGGAFLSLAYFDVPYYVMVIVVACQQLALETSRRTAVRKPSRRDFFGVMPAEALMASGATDVPVPGRDANRARGSYRRPVVAAGGAPTRR